MDLYVFKIKERRNIPRDLKDLKIFNLAEIKNLMGTAEWKERIQEFEDQIMDYATRGKVTRGETIRLEDIDVDRFKEKLIEAGYSEDKAEEHKQRIRAKR